MSDFNLTDLADWISAAAARFMKAGYAATDAYDLALAFARFTGKLQ